MACKATCHLLTGASTFCTCGAVERARNRKEKRDQAAMARALRGKTIRKVTVYGALCGNDCGHGYISEPVIIFTDGTCLRFGTTEGCADYGTTLTYPARPVPPRPKKGGA